MFAQFAVSMLQSQMFAAVNASQKLNFGNFKVMFWFLFSSQPPLHIFLYQTKKTDWLLALSYHLTLQHTQPCAESPATSPECPPPFSSLPPSHQDSWCQTLLLLLSP